MRGTENERRRQEKEEEEKRIEEARRIHQRSFAAIAARVHTWEAETDTDDELDIAIGMKQVGYRHYRWTALIEIWTNWQNSWLSRDDILTIQEILGYLLIFFVETVYLTAVSGEPEMNIPLERFECARKETHTTVMGLILDPLSPFDGIRNPE
jgi:hypothetical protein